VDSLLRAKIDQAIGLMKDQGIDCWIAQLGQETWLHPDPIQALVVGHDGDLAVGLPDYSVGRHHRAGGNR